MVCGVVSPGGGVWCGCGCGLGCDPRVCCSFFLFCVVVCLVVGRGVCMCSSRVTWLLFAVTVLVLVWGLWVTGGLDDACLRGRTVC
jgi:hypothetical protein